MGISSAIDRRRIMLAVETHRMDAKKERDSKFERAHTEVRRALPVNYDVYRRPYQMCVATGRRGWVQPPIN